jgi:glycosyltransferase involved in cell wall biosynthesis
LVDGVNGYSVPFGDHGAFLAAAERAARDPAAVRRCGAAARRRAESLSWARVLRVLEASVFQVIDGSGERGNGHEPIPATSE